MAITGGCPAIGRQLLAFKRAYLSRHACRFGLHCHRLLARAQIDGLLIAVVLIILLLFKLRLVDDNRRHNRPFFWRGLADRGRIHEVLLLVVRRWTRVLEDNSRVPGPGSAAAWVLDRAERCVRLRHFGHVSVHVRRGLGRLPVPVEVDRQTLRIDLRLDLGHILVLETLRTRGQQLPRLLCWRLASTRGVEVGRLFD